MNKEFLSVQNPIYKNIFVFRELGVKCECIDDVSSLDEFECKNECDKDLVDEGFFCTGKGISSVIEGKSNINPRFFSTHILTHELLNDGVRRNTNNIWVIIEKAGIFLFFVSPVLPMKIRDGIFPLSAF